MTTFFFIVAVLIYCAFFRKYDLNSPEARARAKYPGIGQYERQKRYADRLRRRGK
mgnify:CR=1